MVKWQITQSHLDAVRRNLQSAERMIEVQTERVSSMDRCGLDAAPARALLGLLREARLLHAAEHDRLVILLNHELATKN